jgi:hypothetical protein
MKSTSNLIILFLSLALVSFLYKRYESKLLREKEKDDYTSIQKYLLNGDDLAKSKKPILWIHVPYEYNARNWKSFGSRSSYDLNQDYLYLTVRSIVKHCDSDFTICIIDDETFKKLIPNWSIDMKTIANPALGNVRTLGLMKLLYIYGGLMCPISFVCMKNLSSLYLNGTSGEKMFVVEGINRNISSSTYDFAPDLKVIVGSPKECPKMRELCQHISEMISKDMTSDNMFSGKLSCWCRENISKKQIHLLDGKYVGVKNNDGDAITADELFSNNYITFSPDMYGIYIPGNEVLLRHKYSWFAKLNTKQVLQSNTIIGNYMLLSLTPEDDVLFDAQPMLNSDILSQFVGFWKVPLDAPVWSLKPNYLGDNVPKI